MQKEKKNLCSSWPFAKNYLKSHFIYTIILHYKVFFPGLEVSDLIIKEILIKPADVKGGYISCYRECPLSSHIKWSNEVKIHLKIGCYLEKGKWKWDSFVWYFNMRGVKFNESLQLPPWAHCRCSYYLSSSIYIT